MSKVDDAALRGGESWADSVTSRNSDERQLRVLVVGVGMMGALHARAVRSVRRANLCAVVDRNEVTARAVGQELDVPVFTQLGEAIDRTKPNAAIIATPDPLHREVSHAVIEAGLAVLIEKPLATTVEDAEAIVSLARQRDVRLMVGHILRFDPRYTQAAEIVRSGRLGRPVLLTARHWSARSLGQRVGGTTHPLWHFGIHHIDVMQWVSGSPMAHVEASQRMESSGGISTFTALGMLESGAAFELAAGWTLPDSGGRVTELEVHGEDGVLRVSRGSGGLALWDRAGAQELDSTAWPNVYGKIDGLLLREVEHFVSAVLDDTPFVFSAEEAVAAVRSAVLLERTAVIRRLE